MQKKTVIVNFDFMPKKLEIFQDFARWWFEHHNDIEDSSRSSYIYTLQKLIDTFGPWRMKDIQPHHIESFLRAANDTLSTSYVRKLRSMLNQIFRKAVMNGIVLANPVNFADPIRRKTDTEIAEIQFRDSFTLDETKTLFEKLPNDICGNSIRVMLTSGIRPQELLGLETEHIESDLSTIHIRQAVKLVRGKASIGPPKTTSSYRDIPLPSLAKLPIQFLLAQDRRFLVPGKNDFSPFNPSSYRRQYYHCLEKCGVRKLSPHCCRHTYISQMQASGVPMTTISHLVGHSKESMTAHYLHLQDELKIDAVATYASRLTS